MWTKEEQWTSDFMVFEFSRQLGVPTNFGRIFWIFWILHCVEHFHCVAHDVVWSSVFCLCLFQPLRLFLLNCSTLCSQHKRK